MTPNEKSKELFNNHYQVIAEYGEEYGEEILVSILAIKASIVTVNEFIKEIKIINPNDNCYELIGFTEYWQEVKRELEKL